MTSLFPLINWNKKGELEKFNLICKNFTFVENFFPKFVKNVNLYRFSQNMSIFYQNFHIWRGKSMEMNVNHSKNFGKIQGIGYDLEEGRIYVARVRVQG